MSIKLQTGVTYTNDNMSKTTKIHEERQTEWKYAATLGANNIWLKFRTGTEETRMVWLPDGEKV